MTNDILAHHGIKGQKWGVRNYQNSDGSLTEAGKKRYRITTSKTSEFLKEQSKVNHESTNTVKPFNTKPVDISEVMSRSGLSKTDASECVSVAKKIFTKAKSSEPKITSDVVDAVKKSGCKMYGLDNRLKQVTSLAGKIGSDAKDDGVSFEEAGNKIKDSIRYTSISDTKNFTRNYNQINSQLIDKGYSQTKCKNFYEQYRNGNSMHKAVQCTYENKDGIKFELQYQTSASQAAKELKTPLYEERRRQGISSSRAKALEQKMVDLAEQVENPPGVFTIK